MKTFTMTAAALAMLASFGTSASAKERMMLVMKPVKATIHCPCPDGWVPVRNGICVPTTIKAPGPFEN